MTESLLISTPLWVLLFSAIACILFWTNVRAQQVLSILSITILLVAAVWLFTTVYKVGILVVQIGNWPAPFGITLVADLLSSVMVLISAIIAFAIVIYSFEDISPERKSHGFYPVMLFMMFGVCGSFLAGDVFNMYVWFEVMLVASFVLIVLGNTKPQLEGSVKYVVLNFISSGFFLTGVGILYNATGALNMADLSRIIHNHPNPEVITLAAVFFFISFGIKAAVFPLFAWLPASYPVTPISTAGLMAGLLTKVGVYAMIRFFTLLFTHDVSVTHTFLLVVAGLTMITGVLGAIAQKDFRRILSFHIVSQIGYMVMGLAIFTMQALAGSIFYIIHHILVKTNLFLISGIVKSASGHFLLERIKGIYNRLPFVSLLFVIAAFSLAGVPPLSGFWAKFILAKAGLEAGQYALVTVALVVGLLTLFSMSKIWKEAFLPQSSEGEGEGTANLTNGGQLFRLKYLMILPTVFLVLFTLFLSLWPEFMLNFSTMASRQLLNREGYIEAVLGTQSN